MFPALDPGSACGLLLAHHQRYSHHLLSWLSVAFALALNLLVGATPFVDNSCNTAGFLAGFFITIALVLLQARVRGGGGGHDSRGIINTCLGPTAGAGTGEGGWLAEAPGEGGDQDDPPLLLDQQLMYARTVSRDPPLLALEGCLN